MGQIEQKVAKVKGVADVVFCIDVTGSMQPCIDNVKSNVENFAMTIKNYSPNTEVDWRARILGYRDFEVDSEYLINDMDFVSTADELKSQLNKLNADGGGDEHESTLDAILYATLRSNWRPNCHKVIVVFTDAPTHPNLSPKTISDLSIQGDLEIFSQTLIENRIKLFLYGPNDESYAYLATISRTNITQYENAVDGLKNADFKSILETIGKTVSQLASSGETL